MLNGKNILLGITGSIAAYKSVDVVRRLVDESASVTVLMTEAACRFLSPLTFEAVSGRPVYTDLFSNPFAHINLVKDSHLLIIAPASANTINKLASGIADNLLSTVCLSYESTLILAPAMNSRMYRSPLVQESLKNLSKRGVIIVGPESGSLACGEEGRGRMAEPSDIIEAAKSALTNKDLTGHNIIVTAGPTREAIDPVRFISNRSSGKMGFAIAEAAFRRGANVTLISGPTSLKPLKGILFIPVECAVDMKKAVIENFLNATSLIMAAAVSDFMPIVTNKTKMPKAKEFTLKLKETPDILQEIGRKKGNCILIGFAAEIGKDIESAKNKLREKNLDLIVLNDVTQNGAGFEVDTNIVTIIDRKGKTTDYPLMKKQEVANIILDRVLQLWEDCRGH